jgi:hypothetical protein
MKNDGPGTGAAEVSLSVKYVVAAESFVSIHRTAFWIAGLTVLM